MYRKLTNERRLSHRVADQLRELIRGQQLKPGDKLPNEIRLAESFGVSRPTVREAVKALASQNVLEVVRGRGTFVCQTPGISSDPLGLDFLADRNLPLSLIEARQIIEPSVARLAAERAGAGDIERLERFVHEMGRILDRRLGWTEAELGFHRAVAQATRNPVIMRLLPVIHEAIVKTLQYAPRTSADHRQAFDEHRAILEAIRGQAPPEAFAAMQRHLANSYHRTVSIGSIDHDRPP